MKRDGLSLTNLIIIQFKARTICCLKQDVNRLSFSPAGGQHARLAELIQVRSVSFRLKPKPAGGAGFRLIYRLSKNKRLSRAEN
jgi:hypothetical protein